MKHPLYYILGLSFLILSMLVLHSCSTESKPEEFNLTSNVDPTIGGRVLQSAEKANEGKSILVTVVSNKNWVFSSWGGDLSDEDESTVEVYMDRHKEIVAFFEKVKYPVTVTVEGGGSVEQELISAKTTEYQHGSLARFSATPDYGWEFTEWGGDANGTEPEIEIEILSELNITALFTRKDFQLTVEVVGQGEVIQEVVQAKTQDYPFETMVQLTAQPASNWVFSNWSGDLEGTEDSKVVEISENFSVVATFITTPGVKTSSVNSITETSAQGGGEVTSDGGAEVTTRGVCLSRSQSPTLSDSCTKDGAGVGSFTSSLNELSDGTTYYVRAYATNKAGTAYGNEVTFETKRSETKPKVETGGISSITTNSAVVTGNVTDDGKTEVTERGICWSTSSDISDTDKIDCRPSGSGKGNYTYTINNLDYGTVYYTAAYAINEIGRAMGEIKSFTTLMPEIATVSTGGINSISSNSAQGGGNVTSDGGAEVTARGVCLSTSQEPSTSDSCTSDGTGVGSFTSSFTGLDVETVYYVRSYAINVVGTAYGNQVSFVTQSSESLATVSTSGISSVTTNSAQGGGNITNDGGSNVTQRGVCWNTSQNPTVAHSCTNDGSGTGSFSSLISDLSSGTTYYVRAYAINGQGTAYGGQRSFTTEKSGGTSVSTVTDIDGNTYQFVQIGNQKWFTSNLRTTKYRNGNSIAHVTNAGHWKNLSSGAWVYYDNNSAHNDVYGKLYNWFAAADARGICPAGWRVPSDNDWKVLEAALGMPQAELNSLYHRGIAQNIGGKMKTTGNTLWRVPISDPSHKYYNPNFVPATNSSGFSGVPSGSLNALDTTHDGPGFYSMLRDKDMWSSTGSGTKAYIRALSFNQTSVYRDTRSKKFGMAIRCVQ